MHIKGEISDKCEHHGHNMKKKIIVRNTKKNVKRLPSSPATGKSTVPRKGSRKEPRLDSIPPDLFGSSISSPAGKKLSGQKGSPPSKPSIGKLPLESSPIKTEPSTERRPEVNIYVGMDLHSDNVMLGWMDAEGKRLKHQRLPNDIDLILSVEGSNDHFSRFASFLRYKHNLLLRLFQCPICSL